MHHGFPSNQLRGLFSSPATGAFVTQKAEAPVAHPQAELLLLPGFAHEVDPVQTSFFHAA